MKLVFLGTRGEIEARTRRHRMHASLEVAYRGGRLMVDAGEDWLGRLEEVDPDAIVVTHAHPDHAWGLEEGSPCPVWATQQTWEEMDDYPIDEEQRHVVKARKPFEPAEDIVFEAFTVEHSTRAPAVGYRITAGVVTVFYGPDMVYIHEREEALADCSLFVGDGATMKQSFVRKQGDDLIGHTPVYTQLGWCEKEGVSRAIISHCGSQIVEGDERTLGATLREWADERGIEAEFAHDGMEVVLRR